MKRLIPAVVLLCLEGCGTFMNVAPQRCAVYSHPHIYGGVEFDCDSISRSRSLSILCGAIDVPFSLVADTLTLPITISAEIRGK